MNKKKKQVTSVIVATAFTLTTVINAAPTVVYAHEANKQIELDMYGNTSTDIILNNNTEDTSVNEETIPEIESDNTDNVDNTEDTEDTSVNEETIPEIESVITDNLDNTDEVISSDRISYNTTWVEGKELSSDLKVDPGVTLTINAKVTIKGTVTISGGGTIKRGSNYTEELISVPKDSSLTLENITLDGGAKYSAETNSTLNRGTENTGINANGALVHSSGTLAINGGTKLENNFWEDKTNGSAAVYVEGGTTTINDGLICNNYGGAFGAGVFVASEGTLNLEDGTICNNNSSAGAGVYVASKGTLVLNGGTICNNNASAGAGVFVAKEGTLDLNNGKICENHASDGGAGIFTWGKVNMTGGECSDNKVTGKGGIGGGIRITSSGNVNISGGKISNNFAATKGGGIYAYNTVLSLKNVSITNNSIKSGNGGGVWIGDKGKLVLNEVTIKDNKLIKSDNLTYYDDIAINGIRSVDLSCADVSSEVHFSFFNGPIVFKPLGSETLSSDTIKKMSYRSNSGEENYQMWFNSVDKKIYATKIVTNGGEIPFPTDSTDSRDYVDRLAEPIKDGHIFMGWYDNETGSQLTTKPEHTKTYYAKWEKSTYEVPGEQEFTSVYGANENKEFSVKSNDGNPKVKSVTNKAEDIFTVKVDDSDASKVIITPVSNLKAGSTYSGTIEVETAAETLHTVEVRLKIIKATPKPTIPTDLTSLTGMKLSTVTLPKDVSGTWKWENGDILLNNDGTHTYQAVFTPIDTENYDTLTVGIEVRVGIGWDINGVPGKDWKYEDGVFTFIKNGDYVIAGKNIQTEDCIIVPENFQGTITLSNVKISATGSAMEIKKAAKLTLIVDGKNELSGGTNRSGGIKSNKATKGSLIIDSETKGYLIIDSKTKEGSLQIFNENGSGIGRTNSVITTNNDIEIKGGNVNGNITVDVNISGGNFKGNIKEKATVTVNKGGNFNGNIDGEAIINGGNVLIDKIDGKATIEGGNVLIKDSTKARIQNADGKDLAPVKIEIPLINLEVGEVKEVYVDGTPFNISGSFNDKELIIYVPKEKEEKNYKVTIEDSKENKIDNEVKVTPNGIATTQNRWITNPSIESILYGNNLNPQAVPFIGTVEFQYSTTQNGEYSTSEPREVGTYWMKAVVAEGEDYTRLESAPIKFRIKEVSQWIVEEPSQPELEEPSPIEPEESIDAVLNLKSNTIAVGDKVTLNLKNIPKNASCTWSSSNKKVATVNAKGIVTGKKKGVATITCTVKVDNETKKLTAKINVLQLKKEIKTRTVIAGKKIALKVENYKNATCTWSSSNKKVAIVNSKGVVTGLKAGETTIRCKVDGPTKSCFVQYKVKVNTEKKVVN